MIYNNKVPAKHQVNSCLACKRKRINNVKRAAETEWFKFAKAPDGRESSPSPFTCA